MRISDWSSDVCSSDLILLVTPFRSQEMTLAMNDLFSEYTRNYEARRQAEISLEEYLRACRGDPMMYASAPERLLAAMGEPEIIDTSHDQRLGRNFIKREIRRPPTLADFHGLEDKIDRIDSLFHHAYRWSEASHSVIHPVAHYGR